MPCLWKWPYVEEGKGVCSCGAHTEQERAPSQWEGALQPLSASVHDLQTEAQGPARNSQSPRVSFLESRKNYSGGKFRRGGTLVKHGVLFKS